MNKIITVLIASIFLLPSSILYLFGLPMLAFVSTSSAEFLLFSVTAGYGLYCSWALALKYKLYRQSKIPSHIMAGLVLGIICTIFLWVFMGLPSDPQKYESIWSNIFIVYIYGGGPLFLSSILLCKTIKTHLHNIETPN